MFKQLIPIAIIALMGCEPATLTARKSGDDSYSIIRISHMNSYLDTYSIDEKELSIVVNAKNIKRNRIVDLGTVIIPMPKGYVITEVKTVERTEIGGDIAIDRLYIHVSH